MGRHVHRIADGAEDKRQAESCSSSDSTSSRSTSRSPLPISAKTLTMSKSAFESWQDRYHTVNLADSEDPNSSIPDSQPQFTERGTACQFAITGNSQLQRYMSDEDFHRTMEEPSPPYFRPLRTTTLPQSHSCPPNLLQNFQARVQYGASPLLPAQSPLVGPASPLVGPPGPPLVTPPRLAASAPTAPVPVSTDQVIDESAPPAKGKKRAKKPTKKAPKKSKKVVELSDDDDGDSDGGAGIVRWADPEVKQLIAFRLEMDEEFARNAKKQGVNSWDKLHQKMVVVCENFAKSPEACRKKWKTLKLQYDQDKRHLQVSGESRKITCRFFDDIDEGFNNRANVRKLTHGDARGSPNPCPVDLNVDANGTDPPSPGSEDVSRSRQDLVFDWPYTEYILGHGWMKKKEYKIVTVYFDGTPKCPHDQPPQSMPTHNDDSVQ